MSIANLETTLKQLRLSGLAGTVSLRLQEAAANRLAHEEFLELLLQDELNVRKERLLSRRTQAADFHRLKTLEDFDWRFNPGIPRKQIYDLAAGQFIRQAADLLFIGPPGVGKTHLAQALGYEAIKLNFQVLYRSLFDLVRDFLSPGGSKPATYGRFKTSHPEARASYHLFGLVQAENGIFCSAMVSEVLLTRGDPWGARCFPKSPGVIAPSICAGGRAAGTDSEPPVRVPAGRHA